MTAIELDAAGITDPALRAAYAHCRALNARHGRTYFLATRLLLPQQRPAVHALYGFARWADDIVDALDGGPTEVRRAQLDAFTTDLRRALDEGSSRHPVLAALVDTARRYAIDPAHFTDFTRSMEMDLEVTDYATFEDLDRYMHGSAAVIGLQLLPVLGTVTDRRRAEPRAAALGVAFQLTNFIRDLAEDLFLDRVYLPADRLAAHGVDRDVLKRCVGTGVCEPALRRAIADLVRRNREIYRIAEPGIEMLAPVSRPCVATAFTLYQGILDRIEAAGYDVISRRAVVPERRRLAVALGTLGRVAAARARHRLGTGGLLRAPLPTGAVGGPLAGPALGSAPGPAPGPVAPPGPGPLTAAGPVGRWRAGPVAGRAAGGAAAVATARPRRRSSAPPPAVR
ncbi:phytoene/squalene synthase family protein [Allostreptomyces psammosilenae]|uniref:Phytoene synthase n=1 Tax=Allostreptomyces psammosilenae TaxID=1892865 RepID=A0A852ZME7_9ACTN|nr:phytoene/squalene synthase family protein [Allostreptomyces psammosilenae]NYI03596.1 phytoene synthase [Allostreptomyces psammosilenae]